MMSHYDLEKLALLRQKEILAEVTAQAAVAHLHRPQGPVRRVLATTLAFLANRIDPAVWEGPVSKLRIPASKGV